jgi:hypothetical protein
MLVDTAALLLLASSTQPALRRLGTLQMQAPAGAQLMNMPQIYNNPQNVALLMGPFPVLATMMRESLQRTAAAYVQGATNLLDLSMSDAMSDSTMSDSMSDAMSDYSYDAEMSEIGLPPLDEQSITTTAIVGATAAAIALLNLRGGAHHG